MKNVAQIINRKVAYSLFVVVAYMLLATISVHASNADDVLRSAEAVSGPDGGARSITDLIATVINILSFVAGVIAVIVIIINGFKISVSNGDSGKVSSGRSGIIYALVGLVVVVFAQVMVRFVLTNIGT